ncbi:MAG: site-specific DNA-methyltransferase [Myxococcota bacterium]
MPKASTTLPLGIELTWPGKTPPAWLAGVGDADLVGCERVDAPEAAAGQRPGNLLVQGDNLVAMSALRERLQGRVHLVYIDPPFFTGVSYYSQTGIGEGTNRSVTRRAYRDPRARGMAGYIDRLYARLWAIRELLHPSGKLFVHCDWRANGMIRVVLDELFGPACFRNEIVWRRAPNLGRQAASRQLGRTVDTIFVYSKSPKSPFPGPVPRRRTAVPLDGKGKPKGARWDEVAGAYFTTAPRGDYTDASIAALREENRVYDSAGGKVYIKYFLQRGDDGRWYKDQPVDTLWDDFAVRPLRHRPKREDQGYDTQKPEGLLERILGWATRPGDLVLDVYGGSGTTAAVASAMGRRWVACDRGPTAVAVHRRRLLDQNPGSGFDVVSVEAAERRLWALDHDDTAEVLSAFGAEPETGRWGRREGVRIYVAEIDEVMDERRVEELCAGCGAEALVLLAWRWPASDARALRVRMRARHRVEIAQQLIPMDLCRGGARRGLVFPVRAEVQLELQPTEDGHELRVCLTDVQCGGTDDLPWPERVDGWAVDIAGSETFQPSWRSYRSHGRRDIELASPPHRFGRGEHRVRVEVTTIYGDVVARALRVAS